jgi:hypothetical protein
VFKLRDNFIYFTFATAVNRVLCAQLRPPLNEGSETVQRSPIKNSVFECRPVLQKEEHQQHRRGFCVESLNYFQFVFVAVVVEFVLFAFFHIWHMRPASTKRAGDAKKGGRPLEIEDIVTLSATASILIEIFCLLHVYGYFPTDFQIFYPCFVIMCKLLLVSSSSSRVIFFR